MGKDISLSEATWMLEMKSEIENTEMSEPKCFVISNVTGKPTMNLAEIKANLIAQIAGQVRWCDTILAMKNAGGVSYTK